MIIIHNPATTFIHIPLVPRLPNPMSVAYWEVITLIVFAVVIALLITQRIMKVTWRDWRDNPVMYTALLLTLTCVVLLTVIGIVNLAALVISLSQL